MKRFVFALPVLLVLAGIYILVGTPDTVTIVQQAEHSHNWAVMCFLFALVFGLVAMVIAEEGR